MSDRQEIKKAGLKATLPRIKVLNIFEHSAQRHMSAEDIYRILLAEHEDVGLATVYRILTQFEQAGLLIRHHFEGGKAIFELNNVTHHDHILCVDCGVIEEFCDPEIESLQNKIAQKLGFKIYDHVLCLHARCTKEKCPNRHSQ